MFRTLIRSIVEAYEAASPNTQRWLIIGAGAVTALILVVLLRIVL